MSASDELVKVAPHEINGGLAHGLWDALKWQYDSSSIRLKEIRALLDAENDPKEHFKLCCEEQFHLGVISVVKSVNESLIKIRNQ